MDAKHFDALVRSLGASRPRRSLVQLAVGLVLGGTAVAAGLPGAVARRKGKGKKKRKNKKRCPETCPECQRCVNGRSCTPDNGDPCGNSLCKVCQGGACVNRPNNTSCNVTGKCEDGACKPPPDCDPKGATCSTGTTCCSGDCPTGTCATSAIGEDCITNSDCNVSPVAGLNFCNLGFKCQEPVIGP